MQICQLLCISLFTIVKLYAAQQCRISSFYPANVLLSITKSVTVASSC